jgi:4-diphosphocytidyl-2-C-methyl-D-erythritol kinase
LEKDLAWRARQLLEAHVRRPLPVAGELAKRIPTGAGLGGGSSDAAAMLVGLNQLFDLKLTRAQLCHLASQLGSDVTFLTAAMLGQPSARVTGVGHDIAPLPIEQPIHLVLIFPGVSCPTGQVYQAFDRQLGGRIKTAEPERVRQVALKPLAADSLFNDLTDAAVSVQPELAGWLERGSQLLGQAVHLTGSGATLFTLAADAGQAAGMARLVNKEMGLPALATQSLRV